MPNKGSVIMSLGKQLCWILVDFGLKFKTFKDYFSINKFTHTNAVKFISSS